MSFQQLYKSKPTKLKDVKGASSQTIYVFMKFGCEEIEEKNHPWDVDDFERCRALLICYPEWKLRLKEMANLSKKWKVLVDNWEEIEEKYNQDYQKYGNKAYGEGMCDNFIRDLISSVKKTNLS